MLVIGLTGGIASGKSTVARQLQTLGAEILDADKLGHLVLQEPDVIREAVRIWGERILEKGAINRSSLAKIVFAPAPVGDVELAKLERLTHPRIKRRIIDSLEKFRSQTMIQAVVLDAPVMFKAGWHHLCDKIVFVEAPLVARQRRARSRNWEPGELERRELQQLDLDHKRACATDIVQNSGTIEDCRRLVTEMWKRWGLRLP